MKKQYIFAVVGILVLAGGIYFVSTTGQVPREEDGSKTQQVVELSNVPESSSAVFTVDGGNFYFSPNIITVKRGDTVNIRFRNVGGMHDLVVEGYEVATKKLQSGDEDTISFVADTAGSFEYYCSIGTHRQMGMKGVLVVEE